MSSKVPLQLHTLMLDQWAQNIDGALKLQDAKRLAECFPITFQDGTIAVLQNYLWQNGAESLISQFNPDWDWPALTTFARQYLWLCYYINPQNPQAVDPALQTAFNALQTAFTQPNGYLLTDLVVQFVSTLEYKIWLATPLLRIFNNIRSEREPITSKQEILLFISTRLCRVYFTTDQISLCNTVFRSLEKKSLDEYPIAQRVELKYAEGRYALIKGEVDAAFKHLQWSYNNCYAGPNKARVFEYLLLPGILTGRMPSGRTLQAAGQKNPELQKSMSLLCIAIKQVKFEAFYEALKTLWIKKHRFGDLLRSHFPVLILRRVIQLLHKLRGKPRALDIADIRKALAAAGYFKNDDNLLETESACIALIDSKILFANLFPGDQPNESRLLLRPNNPIPNFDAV